MIQGFMGAEREIRRLDELKKKFDTSSKLGLKECNRCGFCCHRRTCVPTPDELVKIAEFLKLSTIDCINEYFAIDSFGFTYYVKPVGINISDLKGRYIPSDRTYNEGKCIFLDDDNLCKIHKVKPFMARSLKCWDDTDDGFSAKDYLKKYWGDDQLKKIFGIDIEDLR